MIAASERTHIKWTGYEPIPTVSRAVQVSPAHQSFQHTSRWRNHQQIWLGH